MEDITGKIELYHNLFLGCLALCILCLIIAVVIFFALDIKNVLGYLTGRKAKKQIQKLQEANALSGRLLPRERANMQYVAKEMKEDMGVRGAVAPGARKVDHVIETTPEENTQALEWDEASREAVSAIPENEETEVLQEGDKTIGTFKIEREIVLIHAEEVI